MEKGKQTETRMEGRGVQQYDGEGQKKKLKKAQKVGRDGTIPHGGFPWHDDRKYELIS